jgi:hypothetical protein
MFVVANVTAGWTTNSSEQAYYFIEDDENGNPLADGSIWVNGSFNDTSFYVYYNGDSYNSDYDNGDNVFEFFDDFDYPNNAINSTKWKCDNSLWSDVGCYSLVISGSKAVLTTKSSISTSADRTSLHTNGLHTFGTNTQINTYGKYNDLASNALNAYWVTLNDRIVGFLRQNTGTTRGMFTAKSGTSSTTALDSYSTNWAKYQTLRNSTTQVISKIDGTTVATSTTNIFTDNSPILFFAYGINCVMELAWVSVSDINTYTTSYGSEESGSWEIDGITYSKRKEVNMTGTFDGQIELDYNQFNSTNITVTTSSGPDLVTIVSPTATNYTTTDILVEITNSTEVDNIWYNWNGTNVTYTTPVTITFPAGEHTLQAWANNTSGDEQEFSVTFDVYTYPTSATFSHNYQLVRNNTNVVFNWTSASDDAWPLTNYTLYVFDDDTDNLLTSYSLTNTTLFMNYSNTTTGVYYPIIESCNDYLCSNSSRGKVISFQSVSLHDMPTLVTSLETYNIKALCTTTGKEVSAYDGSGGVCPAVYDPVCQVVAGVETTKSNSCSACLCQTSDTYYYAGECGVGNSTNITYCAFRPCDSFTVINRNNESFTTTVLNPYRIKSFNTALYENETYNISATCLFKFKNSIFSIDGDNESLTIYNFSISTCADASGFINYTLVDESEGLMTGDIGTFIRVHQPLGDINATLNMSSDNHLQYCITPKKNYTLSSDIYYNADAIGRTEEYYLNDAVYDTTLNNILYLYNLNNTDILNVIVLDEYSAKKVGSVVNLIKLYPSTMSSKTIASAKTNSEGEVNFFYDRNDQIKLTVVEDGITEYQDSEFNKYYSVTGYYSRTVKLGSGIIPSIDNINFDCKTSVVNETNNMVYCWFAVIDGKQRNFSLWVYDTGFNGTVLIGSIIANGTYLDAYEYETTGIYTTDGSLYISSDVISGLYEFKIDGITRKTGVLNYNASAVPIELKYLTLPFVFLVLILGAINPFFALGGFFILGLFADPTTSTFMFFDNIFILGSVVAIIIAFVIEEVKAVTKKR